MKVWVDQDICTGDGLCEEQAPEVFHLRDNLSFVRAAGVQPTYVGGPNDLVDIPDSLLDYLRLKIKLNSLSLDLVKSGGVPLDYETVCEQCITT